MVTAKNIIIATGSIPFVPKGIEVDGRYSSSSVLQFSTSALYIKFCAMLLVAVLVLQARVLYEVQHFFKPLPPKENALERLWAQFIWRIRVEGSLTCI